MSCCRDGFVPYCDARFEICDAERTLGGMFECFLGGRKLVHSMEGDVTLHVLVWER